MVVGDSDILAERRDTDEGKKRGGLTRWHPLGETGDRALWRPRGRGVCTACDTCVYAPSRGGRNDLTIHLRATLRLITDRPRDNRPALSRQSFSPPNAIISRLNGPCLKPGRTFPREKTKRRAFRHSNNSARVTFSGTKMGLLSGLSREAVSGKAGRIPRQTRRSGRILYSCSIVVWNYFPVIWIRTEWVKRGWLDL